MLTCLYELCFELEDLKKQVEQRKGQLDKLGKMVKSKKDELEDIKRKCSDLNMTCEAKEKSLNVLEQKLSSLHRARAEMQTEYSEKRDNLESEHERKMNDYKKSHTRMSSESISLEEFYLANLVFEFTNENRHLKLWKGTLMKKKTTCC